MALGSVRQALDELKQAIRESANPKREADVCATEIKIVFRHWK